MSADQPFSRPVPLRMAMPALRTKAVASDTERVAVADLLGLAALDELELDATVASKDQGFVVDGRVRARVTQACVVTFDPVVAELDLPFRRTLVVGTTTAADEPDVDPLGEDIDYLEAPTVDLGAIAVEELSLGLEPYPRSARADEVLAAVEAPVDGPFATLARRRGGA